MVGSGSGGDRPPINDTAIAFPVAGNDNVQPLWISRHFDSVYSVAVTERAVSVGGHFGFQESPAFDGRGSTDENAPTLTYSWNIGNNRTGSGPVPSHTYTSANTYTVTLTVTDGWGKSASTTRQVTVT